MVLPNQYFRRLRAIPQHKTGGGHHPGCQRDGVDGPDPVTCGCSDQVGKARRVFYSQVRVGQFGRPFKIWKLRSMRSDAEKHGAQWAQQHDARVTRIGLFLRKTRLNEVPQFFNVFRGEMSFVGPRPERPEFVSGLAKEIPFYQQRHLLKPGITGWAQINYPYGATTADALNKLEYDLYYIKHASPLLDFQTILRTIGAVMKGAR
jgi:lipopolysaccharide/colanic/teichoic acid biosynthesis glycosyltransferase